MQPRVTDSQRTTERLKKDMQASPPVPAPKPGFSMRDEFQAASSSSQGVSPAAAATARGTQASGVSADQLRAIMPTLSQSKADAYLPHLNNAMSEAGINTPERQSAFLAQLGHESGDLRYMEEIASGRKYEGRKDLGNVNAGDGMRYKGRGPIQLTGRANYRAAGEALGLDLENNPQRAADPDVGFRTAAWFWNSRKLNSFADSGDFDAITKRINGGFNGKLDRDARYAEARQVLGNTGMSAPGTMAPQQQAGGAGPISVGAQGQQVTDLQNRLKALGFDPGAADGAFGPGTEAQVRAFQQSQGLTADGVVGPQTLGRLNEMVAPPAPAPAPAPQSEAPTLGINASGQDVSALQELLNRNGANLTVDGEFGPATESAVLAYQSTNGLSTDGVVGPQTWASLNPSPPPLETPYMDFASLGDSALESMFSSNTPSDIPFVDMGGVGSSPAEDFTSFDPLFDISSTDLSSLETPATDELSSFDTSLDAPFVGEDSLWG
jgi:predicted chitinase/peptidoglycan hydrolase-like protein with peptidoglycan-binding domain